MKARLQPFGRIVLALLFVAVIFGRASAQQMTPVPPLPAPLDAADAALWRGDYATAVALYAEATQIPDLSCAAAYGLGMTYGLADQHVESALILTQQIDVCGISFRSLVLRGAARQRSGDNAGAQTDYEAALSLQPGVIDSYLYERIATVNPDASALYLRLAAESGREPQGEYVLRNELAQIYRIIGRADEALIQYNAILERGLLSDEQRRDAAAIAVQAANIQIAAGNLEAGYARLQQVLIDYETTPAAFDALIALINAGQPVDLLTRMRINVRNENYRPVVGVLVDYLANPPAGETITPELYLLLGRSQRELGDSSGALQTFQRARDLYPETAAAAEAALEQAETYAAAGDQTNALAAYQAVAMTYPQSDAAPLALLRAARALRAAGDTSQAIAFYDQLGRSYPTSEQAREGLFEAARLLQAAGDSQRAAEFYGRSGSSHALLWQGKVLQAINDPAGARAAWQAAVTADPGTFFSRRACALLENVPPFAPSAETRLPETTPEDIAVAEAWIAQTFGRAPSSAALAPELTQHPLLVRGSELWALGWRQEAYAEFIALHRLYRDDPVAMFQLMSYYQGIRAYRASIIAAVRVIVLANAPITAVPPYIARAAYPIYYRDQVLAAAREYGLDPLYVAALIRQESTYDAGATSIVGARGLMQLMPATAADVAGRMGMEAFQQRDLVRPIVNIPMGSFYLGSTRDFLGGDVIGALLGYNAGPGRAAEWVRQAGGDIDLLYETIPFEETRLYLDIIYGNFAVYRALYGDGMPDCMFSVPPPPTSTPSP